MTVRAEVIRLTDLDGRSHYLAPNATAQVSEAGASSQWHGINCYVKTFDGKTIECQESAREVARMMQQGGVR